MALFWAIVRLSIKNLFAHKMRSFLSILGILIGVASVIVMMALGEGTREAMVAEIRSFGADVIYMRPGFRNSGGVRSADFQKFKIEDCREMLAQVPEIRRMSPEVSRPVQVKFGNKNSRTTVNGVAVPYFGIRNYKLASGRYFSAVEEKHQRKVAVLGHKVVTDMFGGEPGRAVGQEIKISGKAYTVVGAVQEQGDKGGFNPDDFIFVPWTTGMKRIAGVKDITSLSIQVTDEKVMEEAIMGITRVMRRQHRLTPSKEDDFVIFTPADILKSLNAIGLAFSFLIAGIASMSLMVGGIGIMNIMLVTVTERTREIGIRKALGAKRRDIMRQFLIEAVVISLVGGGLGIVIGIGMAVTSSMAGVVTAPVSVTSVLMSLGFCFFVGTFFGLYPARKAAWLDPIEALRYE